MSVRLEMLTDNRRPIPQATVKGGAGVINLNFLKYQIQRKADEFGVLLNFTDDTVEYGSMFNKQYEPIMIMANAYHPEYLSLLFRVTYRGIYAVIDVYALGKSTNYQHEQNKYSTGRMIMNAINGHEQKMRDENQYYDTIGEILRQIYSENFVNL